QNSPSDIDSGRAQNYTPDASTGAQFCGKREATQPAQSEQMGTQTTWHASCDRYRNKKHSMQVHSSFGLGRTRTESSSFDRSAPGSSKPSATAVSSSSILLACACER